MLKKNKQQEESIVEADSDNGNGHNTTQNNEVTSMLQSIINQQKELSNRLGELEDKKTTTSADALLRMVNLTYDTDDKHLPELTRIPLNSARPLSIGIMLESIFDPDVQAGLVPLSSKLRNAYFRLMRSVGGVHLGRGVRLAEEQAASEAESAEERELGED